MEREAVQSKLREMIEKMSKSGKKVSDNINLIYDMGFDSVTMIELFADVEREFDLEFDFEEVDFDDVLIFEKFVSYVCNSIEKSRG